MPAAHVRIIPTIDGIPHPLGRHVEHWDESRLPEHTHPATVAAPQPVLWAHSGQILNQGQLGSCTGNATEQSLATGGLYRPGFTPTEAQAVQIYELATQLDDVPGQYPPTDTGSSGIGACKAAQHLGLIRSYQHGFGITHARAIIAQTPFITGTEWYEGMFHPDHNGLVRLTGQIAGGHEYVVLGWDPHTDLWTMLNSWGPWGVGIKGVATTGLFHVRGQDYAQLLAAQGDVTIPVR